MILSSFVVVWLTVILQGNPAVTLPEKGICAHRGANISHPENTIAAFQEAIRLGAHMIEFDVQMSRDSVLVIMHDKTVDRTTNGSGNVVDQTLDQLKSLDAGSWKNELFSNEKIPTLAETIAIMPKNIWLNVHVKGGIHVGIAVAQLILRENRNHQAILACTMDVAAAVKKQNPRIKICNMERGDNDDAYISDTITMKADFIQLIERAADNLPEYMTRLKTAGIKVNYYDTNSPEKLRRLFSDGVDFPLVNDLAAMMNVAAELGIKPVVPKFSMEF